MWCKFCKRKKKCEYATDRSGSDMTDAHDGMGTSEACSSSSESHSPTGSITADPALVAAAIQQQHNNQVTLAAAQFMQMQMQMRNNGQTTSLGPSPLATSSAAHTPVEDANASDSESDVDDDDEEIDPTVMAQTQEVMIHDAVCTL